MPGLVTTKILFIKSTKTLRYYLSIHISREWQRSINLRTTRTNALTQCREQAYNAQTHTHTLTHNMNTHIHTHTHTHTHTFTH